MSLSLSTPGKGNFIRYFGDSLEAILHGEKKHTIGELCDLCHLAMARFHALCGKHLERFDVEVDIALFAPKVLVK